jgi:hypothetical protein
MPAAGDRPMKTNGGCAVNVCSTPVVRCLARTTMGEDALHATANASGKLIATAMDDFSEGIWDIRFPSAEVEKINLQHT